MTGLIGEAWAEGAAPPQGDPFLSFLPLVVLFVLFYFLLIRPQAKRQKEHKKMLAELAKGDEVVTNGGLAGRVVELHEDFVAMEIARETRVHVQRSAVSAVLPKGTLKGL